MNKNVNVLLVDDEARFVDLMAGELRRLGYQVETANSGAEFRNRIASESFDVVILDVHLPDVEGTDLLHELKEAEPVTAAVMLTGHGTVDGAVAAMKLGALDYLTKPCRLEELDAVLFRASETVRLQRNELAWQNAGRPKSIVGASPALSRALKTAEKAARSDLPVLITGETGTGKELFARQIHQWSGRAQSPYVLIDCTVLSESLLASELFGHEKGAFTGATERRVGLFEAARGGTIFLDEIGDIDTENQAKLLRVLDAGEFRRLGSNTLRKTDVRIIAATNRNLSALVADKAFREDLYHRIAVVSVELPLLRQREGDISELAGAFLGEISRRMGRTIRLHEEAVAVLENYTWPGNIRQLRNTLERAAIFCEEETIRAEDLPVEIRFPSQGTPAESSSGNSLASVLAASEKAHIERVLAECQANRTRTAKALGISVRALFNKLKAHGID